MFHRKADGHFGDVRFHTTAQSLSAVTPVTTEATGLESVEILRISLDVTKISKLLSARLRAKTSFLGRVMFLMAINVFEKSLMDI